MDFPERLCRQLDRRKANGNFRTLKLTEGLVDFSSGDYLGLSVNEVLKGLYPGGTERLGSGGSRLLSGNSASASKTEKFLAELFDSESALTFNSGYNANLSVLSSLPQRGDLILYDALVHASIKDGMRLSLAERQSFKHNDMNDLEFRLRRFEGLKYVVAESVYSMDGDLCPLPELIGLCDRYGAYLILDEAHATGIMGENGGGLSEVLQAGKKIFCRIYTFGKALGLHGAAVAGSRRLTSYLINFARPFIYTTALPPSDYARIKLHFDYLSANPSIRKQLESIIRFYRQCVAERGLTWGTTASQSPIQTVLIPDNEAVNKAAEMLQNRGLDVRAIRSPTVKTGSERLRICLHAYNTHDEISTLASSLASL